MTREEKRETIEYLKKYREFDKQLYQTAPFTSVAHNALVKCLRYWDTAIQALKQEPKWIPVSERLPEERDWYLAVFKEKDTGYQLIPRVAVYIGENNWRIIDEEAFAKKYLDILECVAWMPLPEPYEVESEDNE